MPTPQDDKPKPLANLSLPQLKQEHFVGCGVIMIGILVALILIAFSIGTKDPAKVIFFATVVAVAFANWDLKRVNKIDDQKTATEVMLDNFPVTGWTIITAIAGPIVLAVILIGGIFTGWGWGAWNIGIAIPLLVIEILLIRSTFDFEWKSWTGGLLIGMTILLVIIILVASFSGGIKLPSIGGNTPSFTNVSAYNPCKAEYYGIGYDGKTNNPKKCVRVEVAKNNPKQLALSTDGKIKDWGKPDRPGTIWLIIPKNLLSNP